MRIGGWTLLANSYRCALDTSPWKSYSKCSKKGAPSAHPVTDKAQLDNTNYWLLASQHPGRQSYKGQENHNKSATIYDGRRNAVPKRIHDPMAKMRRQDLQQEGTPRNACRSGWCTWRSNGSYRKDNQNEDLLPRHSLRRNNINTSMHGVLSLLTSVGSSNSSPNKYFQHLALLPVGNRYRATFPWIPRKGEVLSGHSVLFDQVDRSRAISMHSREADDQGSMEKHYNDVWNTQNTGQRQ